MAINMKVQTLVILFSLSLASSALGQTIQEIFKTLPLEYAPSLTIEAKDSLIEKGTYTFPDGDSIETMKASYLAQEDYLRLTFYFTTGQNGFSVIELRKFQRLNDSLVVVYSKYGGGRWAYDQHSLFTFDYHNGTLLKNTTLGLPETIETKGFLKENIPDSLKADELTLNTSYDLNPEDCKCVRYQVNPTLERYDPWIETKTISFIWNGERFIKNN